jgi:LCP family protein required for cell wall assembly
VEPAPGTELAAPERTVNPWIAAGLSVVIPGLGHLYCRRNVRAGLWAAPLAIVLVVYLISGVDKTDVAGASLSEPALWTLFGFNILTAVWRLASATDAFAVAGGFNADLATAAVIGGSVAVALFVAAPHVVVADKTIDAVRLLDIVFAGGAGPPEVPVIPIGTDADIVPDPVVRNYEVRLTTQTRLLGRIFEQGFGDPDAVAVWESQAALNQSPTPGAPFLPFTERVGADRITILLAGGDAGPGRGGLRTDSMMVATINPVTGKAALFGFPRNLGSIQLPPSWEDAFLSLEMRMLASDEGEEDEATTTTLDTTTTTTEPFVSCECFPEQLNALYPFTRRWTGTYPSEVDPGMAALRDVLSHATGLRIDYYVLIDMAAFVEIVEAIGGVDVYVQEPLQAEVSPPREGDPWATVDVDPGWHRLDGFEALAFVRARRGSSDYARMQRQRCMLRAVAARSTPFTLLRGLGGIVDALDRSLVTDLPVSFAPDMLEMTAKLDFGDIVTVGFNPGFYAPETDSSGHPVPDIDRIRGKIASVIRDQDAGIEATAGGGVSECDE